MSTKQSVLILGSGGREHALAWKISQSPILDTLHMSPGNGGTKGLAQQAKISVNDFEAIASYCKDHKIEIIIVGPEDPLVNGIRDFFAQHHPHIYVFGPNKESAQLEGSKDFSKRFMKRHGIPTAKYETFTKGQENAANAFLESMQAPYVLKADGLAAGKGVLIIDNLEEAKQSTAEMLNGKFGSASEKLVIEEFLDGIEVSYFAMCDGSGFALLPEAKDYKRVGEGDTGLNTGGMGAVSPVPFAQGTFTQKVIDQVVRPTIEGLKKDQMEYVGFLFFGLIKVNDEPMVIEYNCRMGDPETEVVLPRLESDLLEAIILAKQKKINTYKTSFKQQTASTVILVSGGYPEAYKKGKQISLTQVKENQVLFHAGTQLADLQLQTSGGRVLACTGLGNNIQEALGNSYYLAQNISFEGMNFRKDIGKDLQ